jgi:hypothetical protein
MEKFNYLNTLLLTFPETLFNVYFAFLVIGESAILPFKDGIGERKLNSIKLLITVICISIATDLNTFWVRLTGINVTAETLENLRSFSAVLFAMIIIFLVYRLNFFKAILAVVIYVVYLLSAEAPYMVFIINFVFKGTESLYNCNPGIRFLYSLPIRVLQIVGIASVWNIKIAFDCIEKIKSGKKGLTIVLISLFIMEMSSYYAFCYSFDALPLFNRILGFAGIIAAGFINYFVLKMYISTINKAINYNINKSKRRERCLYEKG